MPRCVAPYRLIIGSALGSIIAVIMMPQLMTKASPSDTVIGMNIVIIMSGAPRLDRTTLTQATAAIRSRMTEVTTVARARTGTRRSPEAGICRSAGITAAVYVWRGGKAMAAEGTNQGGGSRSLAAGPYHHRRMSRYESTPISAAGPRRSKTRPKPLTRSRMAAPNIDPKTIQSVA